MAINIYEPMRFSSQGIDDLATQTTLTITNGTITVDYANLKKELVFSASNLAEVEGKGIKWSDGRKSKGIFLKDGNLKSDLSINLLEERDFQIANTSVLSFNELGSTVIKSNLKVLGTLKNLKVAGNAELSDVLFISGDSNRVGINTDSPRLALGIKENNIEIALGSNKVETAIIGTITSSNLDIVTDSTPRISIFRTGEVRIHGRLSADEIHTEKTSLLIFREQDGNTNYGKGMLWASADKKKPNKQFVLHANPDRLHSTESLELGENRSYMIDNQYVLTKTTLGTTVTESSLKTVGVLRELQVAGDAAIARRLLTSQIEIGKFSINENTLDVIENFEIKRSNIIDFSINDRITIGNTSNTDRSVSILGNTVIGLVEPQHGVKLTVEGPISFCRKKFETGLNIPRIGQYNKGDIVWNEDPKPSDYIGWVCVAAGSPGNWLPFGIINH